MSDASGWIISQSWIELYNSHYGNFEFRLIGSLVLSLPFLLLFLPWSRLRTLGNAFIFGFFSFAVALIFLLPQRLPPLEPVTVQQFGHFPLSILMVSLLFPGLIIFLIGVVTNLIEIMLGRKLIPFWAYVAACVLGTVFFVNAPLIREL